MRKLVFRSLCSRLCWGFIFCELVKISSEIEKKYLIRESGLEYATNALLRIYSSVDQLKRDILARGFHIKQGYIPLSKGFELADILGIDIDFNPVEARLRQVTSQRENGVAYFTLKGEGDISRNEVEAELPIELFNKYWQITAGKRIEKVRLKKPFEGYTLEIDVYTDGRDLIVAEVEVPSIEIASKLTPIGLDVTNNPKYKNKNLAK